jgi:hypothetical protein
MFVTNFYILGFHLSYRLAPKVRVAGTTLTPTHAYSCHPRPLPVFKGDISREDVGLGYELVESDNRGERLGVVSRCSTSCARAG